MYLTLRLVLFCAVLQLPQLATAKDVYVSTAGNDANPGTKDKPLATVEKAAEAMQGAGLGTIWIGPGEYYLKNGIALGAKHSGTVKQSLVIRAVEPGKTRLSGARVVNNFRPISPDEAKPLISPEAKKCVLVADLKAQGFPPLAKLPAQHRAHGCEEIVFGDRPMQSARWPNEGFAHFTEVVDGGASKPTHWVQRDVYRPGSFRFPDDGDKGRRAKHWNIDRGVWLHGFWCYEWNDEVLLVKNYDKKTGELRFAVKHHYGIGNPWRKNWKHRFYALHVFEELDSPGEYYLDRDNQKLYFWPPGDVAKQPVRLTLCTKPLLSAEHASHLVVRDLTFENARGLGLRMVSCCDCRVENCMVRNMGQNGMSLAGTRVEAVGCEVTQTASCGISVYGGNRKTLTPGECSVRDCHIHHVGRLNWNGGRGIAIHGCGNRMANNLIHHAPTGAVAYGGNEHVLELNEIHDVCILYSDVGVFYTGRDWSSRGNVVRWNYIHDISNNAGHGSSAIYFDDCDSGDTALGNIVFGGVKRGVLLGGGRDNIIHGNIFIDLPQGIFVDARGPRGITLDKPGSWNLLEKCKQVDYLSPLWKKRYPRLAKVMDEEPLLPMGNSMHNNIMIGCEKPFALTKDVKESWLDRKNNPASKAEDFPGLVSKGDPPKLNLSKLPAVWKKVSGFEAIPIEKIGLVKRK
ncbi:MAG: right-handed parallel beta-helix repeat-containing protein [Pirellulales bacterium]|nr:right-handed parallel beta-helix repeat-containing protein [Pirellulales bacterium]